MNTFDKVNTKLKGWNGPVWPYPSLAAMNDLVGQGKYEWGILEEFCFDINDTTNYHYAREVSVITEDAYNWQVGFRFKDFKGGEIMLLIPQRGQDDSLQRSIAPYWNDEAKIEDIIQLINQFVKLLQNDYYGSVASQFVAN